jgi:putative Ca2+/H+ antiporter (TMEM165/GDT1 family)
MVFTTVFIAELGDKTQLATLLFASDKEVGKWTVFLGSSLALIMASAIGVAAGVFLSGTLNEKYLSWGAGAIFITLGIIQIIKA